MKNLCDVRDGEEAAVLFIHGGRMAQQRLVELGILPGERVRMFHNSGAGPLTVRVKGSKLSIGHGLAQKIIVREE
ncbi:MAG: FeoA domain-containing protein [Candidatus Omnitrophica bacterium]|nr:FeoA domain-containing protein [Candidatus Omnitrophota bacterium]MDD5042452.1 FeoA domain-containing protein [Candidatus Omnitrophota bacterium]MDD5501157.1 FeoA domain-containing protein [Candidatus Omnitrophota bacterium]